MSYEISIHGPRVGADPAGREVTYTVMDISIHGPRVGADLPVAARLPGLEEFQSTAPVWGPTFFAGSGGG